MNLQYGSVPADVIFDNLVWRDASLDEVIGCTIQGAEPVVCWTKDKKPVACQYILYAVADNGAELAITFEATDDPEEGIVLRVADIPKRLGI